MYIYTHVLRLTRIESLVEEDILASAPKQNITEIHAYARQMPGATTGVTHTQKKALPRCRPGANGGSKIHEQIKKCIHTPAGRMNVAKGSGPKIKLKNNKMHSHASQTLGAKG